jgi:chromosome partitioning protein
MRDRLPLRLVLSYSREDAAFVNRLAGVLNRSGLDAWLDTERIRGGQDWQDQVQEAIEECDIMLVILSASSVVSRHVKDEFRFALGDGKRVIPLLLNDCKIPMDLSSFLWVDFTKDFDGAFRVLMSSIFGEDAASEIGHAAPAARDVVLDDTVLDDMVLRFREWFGGPFGDVIDLTWQEFSGFIHDLFLEVGYTVATVGIEEDAEIHLRVSNSGMVRGEDSAYVSIKQQSGTRKVGSTEVRSYANALSGQFGYMTTNGEFTTAAQAVAASLPNIRLIDGRRLRRYLNFARVYGPRSDNRQLPSPHYLLAADNVQQVSTLTTKVLAIVQNKGGVGKTTCAAYLAAAFAAKEKRILLVDFDHQANLTAVINSPNTGKPLHTIADYFMSRCTLTDTVRPTASDRIKLIPASQELALIAEGVNSPEAELEFAAELLDIVAQSGTAEAEDWDWIIIDAPPSLSPIVRPALAAAHYVLIPMKADPFSAAGNQIVLDHVSAIRALMGRGVRVLGGVVTLWKDHPQAYPFLDHIKRRLNQNGLPLLSSRIPLDASLARVRTVPQMIDFLQRRKSPGARAFWSLAEEIEALVVEV